MRKILFTLIGFLSICSFLSGKQINVQSAQNVAKTFLSSGTTLRNSTAQSLNLVYTDKDQTSLRSGQTPENYYYVFNVGNDNGFIIVAADDVNVPIIGYSTEGNYNASNLPPAFEAWMKSVKMGTKDAIAKNAEATEKTSAERFTVNKPSAYHVTLPNGVLPSPHVYAKLPGDSFTTLLSIKEDGKERFKGKACIALTDQNDNVKYILLEDTYYCLLFIEYECTIPANALPGNYRLRYMIKEEGTTEWVAIDEVGDGYTPYIDFTVQSKPEYALVLFYGLHTKKNTYDGYTTIREGTAGDKFYTSVGILNSGSKSFEGYYSAALTDENDNVKYILNDIYAKQLITKNVITERQYPDSQLLECVIPANVVPGKYKVRAAYK